MSNLESVYDVLVSWLNRFDFIDTVAVGINMEGTMLISITCIGNHIYSFQIPSQEMLNTKFEAFSYMESRLFYELERQYKLAEVGEE